MGLAPDKSDDGPSFMTSLRNISAIDKLIISIQMFSNNKGKSKLTFGGWDPSQLKPYPTKADPKIYWYDNKFDDKEWGTEMRNILFDGVSLDGGNLTYARVDSFSNFIILTPDYYNNFYLYMKANHSEMDCLSSVVGIGQCRATNMTCADVQARSIYTNMTIRFTDSNAFMIPPSSYLKDDTTPNGIPMCYHMVVGSSLYGSTVILGDTFMENYLVVYDFENTTIGLNGHILGDQPVEPERPPYVPPQPKDKTTIVLVIVIIVVAALAVAAAVFIIIRRRKIRSNLDQYNQIENSTSDLYQKPEVQLRASLQ